MRYEDPDSPAVAIVGVISTILLVAVVLAAQGFYYMQSGAEEQRKASVPNTELIELIDSQRAELQFSGVDEQSGLQRISVDEAAERLIAERAAP